MDETSTVAVLHLRLRARNSASGTIDA